MTPQRKALFTEISLVAQKMAEIVRDADTTIKIPNSEWTIGDMTAHLIISQQIIISILTGKKNPHIAVTSDLIEEADHKLSREYIAGLNKKFLSNFSQRDGAILAKLLIKETESYLKDIERFADTYMVKTHFGRLTVLALLGYSLNHYLIHCSTVAKTLNKELPVTHKNTRLVIPFVKIAMAKLYNKNAAKNFNANFVVAITNVETFSLRCTPQSAKISDTIPSVIDCSLSMDSLTYFLISFGYMSQWKALLLGKVSLRGKKPWLALRVTKLFRGL